MGDHEMEIPQHRDSKAQPLCVNADTHTHTHTELFIYAFRNIMLLSGKV
jgi:hypothetical protein